MTIGDQPYHHLGEFPGSDLGSVRWDAILAYALKRDDIETARSLVNLRWWDYRTVHPGACLFLFTSEYQKARDSWRTMFGIHPAIKLDGFDHPVWRRVKTRLGHATRITSDYELIPPAMRTGLWRSMCFADSYGVPYQKWINWAFEFSFESKMGRMPMPVSLASNRVCEYVLEKWEEDQKNLLTMPCDPRLLSANFENHPTQIAFQEWLLGMIKQRQAPAIALAHYLHEEPFVHVDFARKILGDRVVASALARI